MIGQIDWKEWYSSINIWQFIKLISLILQYTNGILF